MADAPHPPEQIVVRGAREHNLRDVDLSVPRDSVVTFTGVSGSGKSSLAYHTIYQEGQRRFLESLSSYARQFLGRMEKPKVEHVEGLSPTVSIDQKSVGHSPRSTVGTLTEVLDYLRLLFARLGEPACPVCGARVEAWSIDRVRDAILRTRDGRPILVLAPVVRERKGEYRQELADWRARGFVRARIDGEVRRLDEDIELHRYKYHTIELVVDRLRIAADKSSRLAEAVEQAVGLAGGVVAVLDGDDDKAYELYSTLRACPNGHGSLPELEPRLFSFNSPVGACPECDGLGLVQAFREDLIVLDASKSIRDGALGGFAADGRLVYGRLGFEHLAKVGKEFGFDLDTPWSKLTAKQRRVVMHGSGKKVFDFRWTKGGANYRTSGRERRPWPGVLPHLVSVHRNSTSRTLARYRADSDCPACDGTRLSPHARSVTFRGCDLPTLTRQPIAELLEWMEALELDDREAAIGREVLREIAFRLGFLVEVGLGYLTLERRANTLSGGESQRIRLAAQVGSGLRGILYVLDEPSIGLHARDQTRLLKTLAALRDRGNTVCVVEHDEDTMMSSDWLVDVGPGAGAHGGEIVASGPPAEVREADSLTGRYLRGELSVEVPAQRRTPDRGAIVVRGARQHNLRDVDVELPLGCLIGVTGVSGSGKSTLVNHIVKRALRRDLNGAQDVPGEHDEIVGIEALDKVIEIDQSPIGRTPRSNPATYTNLWNHVRDLFAALPESKLREYKKGRFSFNVPGGRCEACEGAGVKTLEMQFLAPVEVVCDDCGGSRFNPETLEIRFKDKNVADVLAMTVDEACEFFAAFPKIHRPLQTLRDVGLGYLQLGQPSTTLSGGEAQRVKLATELHRPATGRTIYLLDEPTTGLHFDDVAKLLACLHRLVDDGNTVLVIEHNLDVLKSADWLVDLGPEGGPGGGQLVAAGTPEVVAANDASHTGKALRAILKPRRSGGGGAGRRGRKLPRRKAPRDLVVEGATLHNLQDVDVKIPLDRFTVVSGPSGSGKTSLAFDTLFAEGQRRFIESLSTYARRFLGRMDRAPVERIEGLGPAIAIDQKAAPRSPRSTVATATEIHDYLRLLFARIGRPHCPEHGEELVKHPPSKIARIVVEQLGKERGYVLAPMRDLLPHDLPDREKRERYLEHLRAEWRESGFVRALVDGAEQRLDEPLALAADGTWPELELVVDRTKLGDRGRIVDAAAQAAELSGGRVVVRTADGATEHRFTTSRSCSTCGFTVPEDPHPRWFSFNHHSGACPRCSGLGRIVACDPKRLVNHPDRPTFAGAIKHKGAAFTFLTRANGWYASVAAVVAEEFGFDLDAPFEELDDEAKRILLYGCGERRFDVEFEQRKRTTKRTWEMAVKWKGLCTQIEEWFHGHDPEQTEERFATVMTMMPCPECNGQRLGQAQRHVTVGGRSLPELTSLTVEAALAHFGSIRLRKTEREIAKDVLVEITNRLGFLDAVGLGYLTLDRSAATLSGGEAQRIRLATQLGNRLVGVLYVLDEPTIGLHPRDTQRLVDTLLELRDLGNTIVAVEHDEAVIRQADWVVDLGPGAGRHGGQVVAAGTPAQVEKSRGKSLTGKYLRGELAVPAPAERREPSGALHVRGADIHNLRGVDVELPTGVLTVVSGVSGSGKSSLVMDVLRPALADGELEFSGVEGPLASVVVDQSPIGTTPSSNPATYTGVFTPIRELFAQLPASKAKGFGPGRFSFNVAAGRCDACEGKGQLRVEMHFLADVWITCDVCGGARYNSETLQIAYRGRTIADVLRMEVADALEFFGNVPAIARPLRLLAEVGLGYLQLGQAANTLSGGEAQRIKLVAQLAKRPRGHTVFLLDEPTTGLHMDDVAKLIGVLHRLVDRGDTVIVIEHHVDVIRSADWVVELGPGAGADGGRLVATGTPEAIAEDTDSVTGPYLAEALGIGKPRTGSGRSRTGAPARAKQRKAKKGRRAGASGGSSS